MAVFDRCFYAARWRFDNSNSTWVHESRQCSSRYQVLLKFDSASLLQNPNKSIDVWCVSASALYGIHTFCSWCDRHIVTSRKICCITNPEIEFKIPKNCEQNYLPLSVFRFVSFRSILLGSDKPSELFFSSCTATQRQSSKCESICYMNWYYLLWYWMTIIKMTVLCEPFFRQLECLSYFCISLYFFLRAFYKCIFHNI